MTAQQVKDLARAKGLITDCAARLRDETVDGAGQYGCMNGHLHSVWYTTGGAEHSPDGFDPAFQRAWAAAEFDAFHSLAVELGEREDGDVMLETLKAHGYDLN